MRAAANPLLLAHRGDHRGHPENSLAAFRAAMTVPGVDGVELDVRASRDGVPVVVHDPTLLRGHGRHERVRDLDVRALADVGVPTLGEVLAALPPTAFIDVELKEDVVGASVETVRAARGDPPRAIALSSFEPAVLRSVARTVAGWPRWLNADDLAPGTLDLARSLGCDTVSVSLAGLDRSGLERARALGLMVAAWTADDPDELDALRVVDLLAICVEGAAMDALVKEG